jgi:hypothetical protein
VRLAIEIVALVAAAVAILALLPRVERRRNRRTKRRPAPRPADLERLERLVVTGCSTAGNVHARLRPELAEIARVRLRRHAIRLDRDAEQARDALGEELWELVRPGRSRPEDPHGDGIALTELAEMIDRLEAL